MDLAIDQVKPMLALEQPVPPFTSDDWTYEIKFDGYRCLASIDKAGVQLRTRNGADCTGWYPEVVRALADSRKLRGGTILDGEACILDNQGRSDFDALHARARRRRFVPGTQVTFIVFDVLVLRGRSVMNRSHEERKEMLELLLSDIPKQTVLFLPGLPAQAELFQQIVVRLSLEGFVAKRKDSIYQPGVRTADWLKIKRKGAVPAERFKR